MPLPPALSLSLFYLATFAVLGVYLPCLNLYFERIGLTGLQIGIVSLITPLLGALAPTAGGVLADRLGRRRDLVVLSSVLAPIVFCLMLPARTFGWIVLVLSLFAALRAPALPLVEAKAMEVVEAGGPAYGTMRAWGSLAFIAASLGAGPIVGRFGDGVMLPILILLLALNGFAAVLLPSDAPSVSRPALRPSLAGVMKGPGVGLFLAASVLSQASHGPYYVFYSITLKRAGYSPTAIGLLWALAVGCEVIAMWRMHRLLDRFGTLPTMGACLLLGAVRWWICASSTAPLMMAAAQALHAASYAAYHVAAVTHTHRVFGTDHRASGQAIFSSMTYGVGNVVGMLLSGLFYDRLSASFLFAGAASTSLAGGVLLALAARRGPGAARGL